MPLLSHCANSQCSKPFLRLREGKLFLVEAGLPKTGDSDSYASVHRPPNRKIERYWLCDQCAAVWTLIHDKDQGIRLTPLPRPAVGVRPAVLAKWNVA